MGDGPVKLPRWLDRERRIHDLTVLLREKTQAATMWFRLYQKLSADLARERAGRDTAQAEAKALAADLATAREQLTTKHTELTNVRASAWEERKQFQERLVEARKGHITGDLVPMPTVRALPDDRTALYRLEAENARLRDRVAELEAKYEGVPS